MIHIFRKMRDSRKPLLNSRGGVNRKVRDAKKRLLARKVKDNSEYGNDFEYDWEQAAYMYLSLKEEQIRSMDDEEGRNWCIEQAESDYDAPGVLDIYDDENLIKAIFSDSGIEALSELKAQGLSEVILESLCYEKNYTPWLVARDIFSYWVGQVYDNTAH